MKATFVKTDSEERVTLEITRADLAELQDLLQLAPRAAHTNKVFAALSSVNALLRP